MNSVIYLSLDHHASRSCCGAKAKEAKEARPRARDVSTRATVDSHFCAQFHSVVSDSFSYLNPHCLLLSESCQGQVEPAGLAGGLTGIRCHSLRHQCLASLASILTVPPFLTSTSFW